MKTVVLLDGHSLLFRAYHALPKIFTDQKGNPTNAVYGFFSMLIKIVEDLKPNFLAVAFDEKGPTFRHQELVTYKEGRPEMDNELEVQQPVVRELLKAFAIPVYSIEGYEGEDIIATLIAQLTTHNPALPAGRSQLTTGLEFYIVSGDRDVLQLVDDRVKVYSPLRRRSSEASPKKGLSEPVIYTPENVAEVFGVKSSQIPDFKGLRGDQSDRIPGVFGIGEKTAAALIDKYGTVENLYQKIAQVSRGFGENVFKKLSEGAEQAILSKRLATIRADAPLKINLADLEFSGLTKKEGQKALKDLGFRSLLKRLGVRDEIVNKAKANRGQRPTIPANQASLL